MKHVANLGAFGTVAASIGAFATWNAGPQFGPHWYPVALIVTALPAVWIGGRLFLSKQLATGGVQVLRANDTEFPDHREDLSGRSSLADTAGDGKALSELRAAIQAQGIAVTGRWFTHHLQPPGEDFNFECCLPVAAPVKASGRVQPGEWPAMTVVRTIYHGGYEGLGAAWGEFMESIQKNGHRVGNEIWERYLVGPEASGDATKWQTELTRSLI